MGPKTVRVRREDRGWIVSREGTKGTRRAFARKPDAVAAAKVLARDTQPSQVVIYNSDGRIQEYRTYGLPRIQQPPYRSQLEDQIQLAVEAADTKGN
ncbi:MAG: DUF2188 domain-containing protein [Bryobacteraceae bacterium]